MALVENKELMAKARESLKGNWGIAIGAFVVYTIILNVPNYIPYIGGIGILIIAGPIITGYCLFCLALSRGQDAKINMLFEGFEAFANLMLAYLWMILYIFVRLLLLIVPGIIAAFAYSQTFFILAENKDMAPKEAIELSKHMMDGNKGKFFCLQCRFIGWYLLCILTLGIGFLWLGPYMSIADTKFYEDVKANFTGAIEVPVSEQPIIGETSAEAPSEEPNPEV